MNRIFSLWVLFGALATATLISSCEMGSPIDNFPPKTTMFLDEINLTGEQRLNTFVRLHWLGDDRDGYVVGYEVTLDGQNWRFTPNTDSTFRFELSAGSDTTDITVQVRAVDNDGAVDPDPASLVIPIQNTAPVAGFDSTTLIPDTVFSIWSTLWFADDFDGTESIDSIFIRANDGPWYPLASNIRLATFRPMDPFSEADQDVQLFVGTNAEEQAEALTGLRMNDDNVMYLRVKDIAGSFSEIDTSNQFFLRPQRGDLLLVDAHGNSGADNTYRDILGQVDPNHDIIDILENTPRFWNPTFSLLLEEYDKVVWYSSGRPIGATGDLIALEVAADEIQRFLNGGGKLMVSLEVPSIFTSAERETSIISGFSPIDSLDAGASLVRLSIDSALVPVGDLAGLFKPLVSNAIITGVDPFIPKGMNDALFVGELSERRQPYQGATTMAATSTFSNGEIQQVFFSAELHRLNKDPEALRQCFDVILNNLFAW